MIKTLELESLGVEGTTIDRRGEFYYCMNLLDNAKRKRGMILTDADH